MSGQYPIACASCGAEFKVHITRKDTARFCSRKCYAESKKDNPVARFWPKVQKSDTCWLWTAAACPLGYGRFGVGGEVVLAHRFSYELHRGRIPDGLSLDHLCRTPRCVNPDHLEPVSQRENPLRGIRTNKATCRNGHPMIPENIAAWALRKGHKTCRLCVAARVRLQRDAINARQRWRRRRGKVSEAMA
jgi:hypothetical protein